MHHLRTLPPALRRDACWSYEMAMGPVVPVTAQLPSFCSRRYVSHCPASPLIHRLVSTSTLFPSGSIGPREMRTPPFFTSPGLEGEAPATTECREATNSTGGRSANVD